MIISISVISFFLGKEGYQTLEDGASLGGKFSRGTDDERGY